MIHGDVELLDVSWLLCGKLRRYQVKLTAIWVDICTYNTPIGSKMTVENLHRSQISKQLLLAPKSEEDPLKHTNFY